VKYWYMLLWIRVCQYGAEVGEWQLIIMKIGKQRLSSIWISERWSACLFLQLISIDWWSTPAYWSKWQLKIQCSMWLTTYHLIWSQWTEQDRKSYKVIMSSIWNLTILILRSSATVIKHSQKHNYGTVTWKKKKQVCFLGWRQFYKVRQGALH